MRDVPPPACRYDFFARQETVLGQHAAAVRCVEWLSERGLLATGSWDSTLRCWDPRLPNVSGTSFPGL